MTPTPKPAPSRVTAEERAKLRSICTPPYSGPFEEPLSRGLIRVLDALDAAEREVSDAANAYGMLSMTTGLRRLANDDVDWKSTPCPKGCGCSLMTWWKFCPGCGRPIDKETP